jgi:hypothetical protein
MTGYQKRPNKNRKTKQDYQNKVNVQEMMKEKSIEERNEIFDSSVREQLAGYEPKVPHALWNRISSELDNGEASDVSPIAIHHEQSTFGKWKLAMAAVVILTLSVGTLLYTLNPKGESNITTAPVAKNTVKAATTSQPIAPVQVTETRMVAQSIHAAPAVKKSRKVPVVSNVNTDAVAKINEPAPVTAKQDQTNQDEQLALAPVLTENKPIEVGSIPLSSLNINIRPSTVNDEITVIKSRDKKKKHSRRGDESTRVIVLEKKYDKRPDIRYQVPVRF